MTITTALQSWQCPSGNCWTIQEATDPTVRDILTQFWTLPSCPYCSSINGGCEWGSYTLQSNDGTLGCISCQTDPIKLKNRVIINTQITSCSQPHITTCDKNFYPDPNAPEEGACLPCLQTGGLTWSCKDGFYPLNCIAKIDDADISTRCTKCTEPVLSNTTIFQYGQGFAYSDCSAVVSPRIPNYDTCAYFETPKWGGGYCSIACAAGFISAAYVPPFQIPNCIECATTCNAGYYPPSCPGQTSISSNGVGAECLACSDVMALPEGAIWVASSLQTCAWVCMLEGYYANGGNGGGVCVPCPTAASVEGVCSAGFKWLGCGISSQGECRNCSSSSVAACDAKKNMFLKAEVFMEACVCANCSVASAGINYTFLNCTDVSDAIIRPCSKCVAGQTYATKTCTIWVDTICSTCSKSPQVGFRLVAACTLTSDAVYAPCPSGMACDGSATPFLCILPHVARQGVCVCAPAMKEVDKACVPISCPFRYMFPDPFTGICQNCSLISRNENFDNYLVRSIPGLIGFDEACGCNEGYFMTTTMVLADSLYNIAENGELREEHTQVNVKRILKCWPCGDLGCIPSMQYQTSCDGFSESEPTCVCALGPAMQFVQPSSLSWFLDTESPCKLECAPGFISPSSSDIIPGLWDDYSFLSMSNMGQYNEFEVITTATTTHACWINAMLRSIVAININVLLAVCTDGNVTMLVYSPSSALYLTKNIDLSLFEMEGVRENIRGLDVEPHGGNGAGTGSGLIWFAFGFWGYCDINIESSIGDCSAIELLSVQPYQIGDSELGCVYGMCVRLGSSLWGNEFQMLGISGSIQNLAWSPVKIPTMANNIMKVGDLVQGEKGVYAGSLFWIIFSATGALLVEYDIVFYDASVDYSARIADPVIRFNTINFLSQAVGLEMTAHGMYVALPHAIGRLHCDASLPQACSIIFQTMVNNNNNNSMLPLSITGLMGVPHGSGHLLLFQNNTDGWYQLDLWNTISSVKPSFVSGTGSSSSSSKRILMLVFLNNDNNGFLLLCGLDISAFSSSASKLRIYTDQVTPCPIDTAFFPNHYQASSACQAMQCVRAEPCGPFSVVHDTQANVIVAGSLSCECVPGYYYDILNQACQPCSTTTTWITIATKMQFKYFFCPGGNSQPQACPIHAITISNIAATQEECLCIPGYFHFAGECMQCPTSLWCPLNGTMAPIPCYRNGTTLSGGAMSPLDCICPSRTHGLLCEPCDDSMDCSTMDSSSTFMTVAMGGWGGVWGMDAANECLGKSKQGFLLYTSPATNNVIEHDLQSANSLAWNWIAVVPTSPSAPNHIFTWKNNITACMNSLLINFYFIILEQPRPVALRRWTSCGGRHWEWNGLDSGASGCTCVAGYEEVPATAWGTQCFPCLNGTVRPRRSKGGCVPCGKIVNSDTIINNKDVGAFLLLAPFLGMSACICPDGMSMGSDGLCSIIALPTPSGFDSFFARLDYVWILAMVTFGLWLLILCILGVAFV